MITGLTRKKLEKYAMETTINKHTRLFFIIYSSVSIFSFFITLFWLTYNIT